MAPKSSVRVVWEELPHDVVAHAISTLGELELRELVWREVVGQRRRGILARRPEAVGGGGAVGEAVPLAVQLGALGGDRGEDGALRL